MTQVKQFAVAALMVAVFVSGCTKKDEPAGQATSTEGSVTKKETVVKVPEKIKGKWKSVTVALKDKKSGSVQVYPINIGSSVAIPGSDFSVKVENFFPHFVMEGINLTSQSNDTKNPAAEIRISRDGKEIYHGWLFANYPTTNIPKEFAYDMALTAAMPVGQN